MTSSAIELKESGAARDTKPADVTQPGGLSKDEILRLVTERRNSVEGDAANFANSANSANSHEARVVAAPFIKPLKDFHQRGAEQSKQERKKHNAAMAVWSAKCAAVESRIKKKAPGAR
jgi:hypothetical protein